MSFNRENVVWQSHDGTWSRGFYTVTWVGDDDPEWDVEYDWSTFEWVSTGHATERNAENAWPGANPGGWTVVEFNADNAERSKALDTMAAARKNR